MARGDDWSWKPPAGYEVRRSAVRQRIKSRKKLRKPKPAKDFYESQEWKTLRYKVLVYYGAKCMLCNATREDGVKMHVDHIKPRSLAPELELVFENMQVLCETCNTGKLHLDDTDFRPKTTLTSEELAELEIVNSARQRLH